MGNEDIGMPDDIVALEGGNTGTDSVAELSQ